MISKPTIFKSMTIIEIDLIEISISIHFPNPSKHLALQLTRLQIRNCQWIFLLSSLHWRRCCTNVMGEELCGNTYVRVDILSTPPSTTCGFVGLLFFILSLSKHVQSLAKISCWILGGSSHPMCSSGYTIFHAKWYSRCLLS